MINLTQPTPNELNMGIAKRLTAVRKRRRLSQKVLSERSGVSLGSLKRFEHTGEISLKSLSKLAIALNVDGELQELFAEVPFLSIEEIINGQD